MMKHCHFFIIVIIACFQTDFAHAKRVALVIGASSYEHVPTLPNAANDAKAMYSAFENLDFDSVTLLEDPTKGEIERALLKFRRIADGAEAAVIFYAGHGIGIEGKTRLIPIEAKLEQVDDVDFETIDIDVLQLAVRGAKGVGLIILDACRDNPFVAIMERPANQRDRSISRGLAPVEPAGDILVWYAARDGATAADGEGNHSPFTAALLANIATPGLEIGKLFRTVAARVKQDSNFGQEPFEYGTRGLEDFFFKPGLKLDESLSDSGGKLGPGFATACDQLAAHPDNPDNPPSVTGVPWGVFIDPDKAITICEKSAGKFPQSRRIKYNLGRAYSRALKYDQAVKFLKDAADLGSVRAMASLGSHFSSDKPGIQSDYKIAFEYFKNAADAGYGGAMASVGWMYKKGRHVKRDYSIAMKWYQRGAEAGNARSIENIGFLFEKGQGVQKDFQLAIQKYKEAFEADKRYGSAANNVGRMYHYGRGVDPNYGVALKWYRLAADAGNSDAMAELGRMYQTGKEIEQNFFEALTWYRRACNGGEAWACNNIGSMYQQSEGVSQDYTLAKKWYKRALVYNPDYDVSLNNIGDLYYFGRGVEQNFDEAVNWYRRGAAVNGSRSLHDLGYMYANGFGVEKDVHEAFSWYLRSAKEKNPDAMNKVGWSYQNGVGVEEDYEKAREWYIKAADADNTLAMWNLARLYRDGKGVAKDPQKELEWYDKLAETGDEDAKKAADNLRNKSSPRTELPAPYAGVTTDSGGYLGDAPVGERNASVKFVVYSSLSCGHCAKFYNEVLPGIMRDYVNTGKVEFTFRDYPLDDASVGGALIARCEGREKYNDLIALFYAQRSFWNDAVDPVDQLKRLAIANGVSPSRIEKCLKDQPFGQGVIDVIGEASKAGVQSTPAFFVNGKRAQVSWRHIQMIVDSATRN